MSKWLEFFDCIYLINLSKRVDRLLEATEELEKFNIPFKRISAIEKENGAEGLRDTMLLIFNEALEQQYERIFVFEDDAMFCNEDVNGVMDKVVEQLPLDFRIVYMGCQASRGFSNFHSPNLLPVIGAFATHAWGISVKAIREMVDLQLQGPIDNFIVREIQPMGGCYTTYPLLATQRPGYSDIGKAEISWMPFINARFEQKIHELKSRM